MIFHLTVISGPKEGELSIGDNQKKTIGRSPKADWSFPEDGHMSGLHCEIINHETYVELVDRKSLNKTWLNNKEIDAPTKLNHGDRIRAGTTIFSANIQLSPPQPPKLVGEVVGEPARQPAVKVQPEPVPQLPVQPEDDPYLTVVPEDDPRPVADTDPEDASVVVKPVVPLPNTQPMPQIQNHLPSKSAAHPGRERSSGSNSPIVDSSFSPPQVVEEKLLEQITSKLRRLEKPKLHESTAALRSIVDSLLRKRALRFIVHFLKIGKVTPSALHDVKPVYPSYPGAPTHLPVILSHAHWLSPSVQEVLGQLIANDALIILISKSGEHLDNCIDDVSTTGVTGYGEEGGFFGWCWPSAFLSIVENLGIDRWPTLLGKSIEGVLLFSPKSSSTLIAYANDDLANLLLKYGFIESEISRS